MSSNQWYLFFCRCPVYGCEDSDRKKWTHADCGGMLYVNYDAFLGCGECGLIFPIFSWNFKCDGHGGYYEEVSQMGLLYMAAIGGDVCNSVGDMAWALRFAKAVRSYL